MKLHFVAGFFVLHLLLHFLHVQFSSVRFHVSNRGFSRRDLQHVASVSAGLAVDDAAEGGSANGEDGDNGDAEAGAEGELVEPAGEGHLAFVVVSVMVVMAVVL